MKAILTNSIILLILFPVKLLSQPFPESVNTNNKTCTVEPIEKVELSISLILNDDESSHSKEKKKKAISKQIKIANCLYGKKKYQELLEFLKNLNQQINLYTSLGLDNEIFELFFLRGKALRAIGNWQQASSAFKAALNISQAHPTTIESEKLSDLYFNLGRTYRMLNDYTLALDYFNQTLTICIESDFCPKERQAKIYIYMGDCYKFLGKKDLSYIQFKKATSVIDNLQESTRNQILILLLQIKGRMHNYFDEYDDAVQCLEKGIKLCQREYGLYHEKTAYRIDALGNTYYYLKKYSKAIIKFQEAVDVFKALGSKNNYAIADGYSKIAACYTNLNDFQKAEHYLDSCFRILEFDRDIDHPFEEYRSSHTHLLIILYFKAKNHQKAYEAGLGTEELQEAAYWFNLCVELIE
ncbi:MAG: tetratricopeptide repeat protein, partial [Bacteroidetes bacterium]|nr:tetratricopeptide repeat protein [Bacteroidota bacterium]